LPTLPLYLPGAVYLLRTAAPPGVFALALAALVFLQIFMGQPAGMRELRGAANAAELSAAAIEGLDDLVPHGSVLLGDRRLHEQIHFTGQWKLADAEPLFATPRHPSLLEDLESDPAAPNRPSPMQRGKGAELRARFAHLQGEARIHAMLRDLEMWAAGAEIFWVVPEDEIQRLPKSLPRHRLELAGLIALPPAPQSSARRIHPLALSDAPLTLYRLAADEAVGKLQ
jgi:hypothetical protein